MTAGDDELMTKPKECECILWDAADFNADSSMIAEKGVPSWLLVILGPYVDNKLVQRWGHTFRWIFHWNLHKIGLWSWRNWPRWAKINNVQKKLFSNQQKGKPVQSFRSAPIALAKSKKFMCDHVSGKRSWNECPLHFMCFWLYIRFIQKQKDNI